LLCERSYEKIAIVDQHFASFRKRYNVTEFTEGHQYRRTDGLISTGRLNAITQLNSTNKPKIKEWFNKRKEAIKLIYIPIL